MAYRLWDTDVEQGITDFNDDYLHVLKSTNVNDKEVALLFNSYTERFAVANGLTYHRLQSIKAEDWTTDFVSIEDAEDCYRALISSECLHPATKLEVGVAGSWVKVMCRVCGEEKSLHPEDILNLGR